MQERLLTEEATDEYDGVQSDEDYFHIGPVEDVILVQWYIVEQSFVVQVRFVVTDLVGDGIPIVEEPET